MKISTIPTILKNPKVKTFARYTFLTLSLGAAASEGSCIIRQKLKNEPVDKFVRAIDNSELPIISKNPLITDFTQSLVDNKSKIQSLLDISDEDYNLYSKLAIGIAKEETLFGLSEGYSWKKNVPHLVRLGKKIIPFIEDGSLSKGLTNLKIDDIGKQEKETLNRLGVSVKDIYNPEKAAIASIVHLHFLNKIYNNYQNGLAQTQQNPLTREEYLLAVWKGYRLLTNSENEKLRKKSIRNMETITSDRFTQNPKDYVWKVLCAIGLEYDIESDSVIKK